MKLMLDVINEETGEVRGEVKIDANVLREQRAIVVERFDYLKELSASWQSADKCDNYWGAGLTEPADLELLDGVVSLMDGILDVAEQGRKVG